MDGCTRTIPATRTAPRARRSISSRRPLRRQESALSRTRTPAPTTRTDVWKYSQPGAQPLPERVERPGRRHPPGQALQRGRAGREASLVTSMGRMAAHTGQDITFDEMLNCDARVRPRRGQADDGLARPAAGRRQRQISRPAAGNRHGSRVLIYFHQNPLGWQLNCHPNYLSDQSDQSDRPDRSDNA